MGRIQPLLLLGRYDEALAAGERGRAIFQEQGNTRRLARLEINIGNVYHRQDRFSEALACYERAYQQLLVDDDAEGLAAALSNLSLCYIGLNEFTKALEMHRVARRHCEQKGMPILVAYADYNIAYLHFLRGEYGRAIQMLRDASLSAKKADDAYQIALCNLDLSEIYLELNLSADAEELGRAAHEDFKQLGFGYEGAKALAFTAIAASRQGQAIRVGKTVCDCQGNVCSGSKQGLAVPDRPVRSAGIYSTKVVCLKSRTTVYFRTCFFPLARKCRESQFSRNSCSRELPFG